MKNRYEVRHGTRAKWSGNDLKEAMKVAKEVLSLAGRDIFEHRLIAHVCIWDYETNHVALNDKGEYMTSLLYENSVDEN